MPNNELGSISRFSILLYSINQKNYCTNFKVHSPFLYLDSSITASSSYYNRKNTLFEVLFLEDASGKMSLNEVKQLLEHGASQDPQAIKAAEASLAKLSENALIVPSLAQVYADTAQTAPQIRLV